MQTIKVKKSFKGKNNVEIALSDWIYSTILSLNDG